MTFLSVHPRGEETRYNLPVITDSIEVIPDVDLNITDLNRGSDGTKYKHFFNNGFGGITFKCSLYLNRSELIWKLHEWFKDSTVLLVATDAIDIQLFNGGGEGAYIITKNPSRKQDKEYTTWELEFTSYTELTLWKYKNDNSNVKAAIKRAKKAKTAKKMKLSDCKLDDFVYSKKKKESPCVKLLQQELKSANLYINGTVDGWFNDVTLTSISALQKKHNLIANGKVDKKVISILVGG